MQLKANLRFTNNEQAEFFSTLRKRVDTYFRDNKISPYANAQMIIKSIVLLSAYFVPFFFIVFVPLPFWLLVTMWSVMGFALAGVGMSVMHDANHGSYSSNKTINAIMGYTLNVLGGAVFNWKLQHNVLHHTYTNIVHMDEDIEDKLIMRFSPHTELKWYHKFQWVYAFFFYGILTLYWALIKDFVQFVQYKRNGVNKNTAKQNRIVLLKIIGHKVIYFSYFFLIPCLVFNVAFLPHLYGFLWMQFIAGIILTTVFQLAHTVEGTTYPLPNEGGTIENNWAIHQMNTTVNFSRKNKFISWYVGGLNFQVEHHLFPRICHVHYPAISEIVKTTAEEYNIPYLENKSLTDALNAHVRALKKLGLPSINEAIA